MIPRIKGTQDFLDLNLFNFLVDAFKNQAHLYSFSEVKTPIIEHLSLFQRSLGQETEVVSKEMFVIESRHENDDERMCLRPEMTAPIVRAFNDGSVQTTPWRVFSWGPCFRYERPQKGRYRQFHQITMEIIGSDAVAEDIQLLTMLHDFFRTYLHLNAFELHINYLGCSDDRAAYVGMLKVFLDGLGEALCSQCIVRKERNILRVFDCKNSGCQALYQDAPRLTDMLCECCSAEWTRLQNTLTVLHIPYVHRTTLVRGLDYYNKTVFEFVGKNLGSQDAFCGGGRYNQLVKQLGARQDYPSIGAAIGIERLMLVMQAEHGENVGKADSLVYVIISMSLAQHADALKIAHNVRLHDISIDVLFEGSVKSMFRKADKLGADLVIVLGEDEQKEGVVVVKDMASHTEEKVKQSDLVHYLEEFEHE